MLDYHIHSNFSADCETSMETTIQKAIQKGLKEICFTEHIDYDYPDESIVFELDINKYGQAIKHFQATYGDQVQIRKGVEIGVQPHLLDRYEALMGEEKFDFVICSMHTARQQDLHSKAFFKGRTIEEAHQTYYEELLDCVKRFKRFSILGHIDLIKRYSARGSSSTYHSIIKEIFDEIIPAGKGIELNTSGKRYGLEYNMPSPDILKLYKDCGGEIITLGSDSHVENHLAYDFQNALELLKSVGFRFIASYRNGEPEFHPIEELLNGK